MELEILVEINPKQLELTHLEGRWKQVVKYISLSRTWRFHARIYIVFFVYKLLAQNQAYLNVIEKGTVFCGTKGNYM